jgi:eukaryotic-like serine/threonine-protein kinase
MDPGTLRRVRELFEELSELPPSERSRRLAGESTDVRAQVGSLLASHESAKSFLEQPAAALVADGDEDADPFIGFTLGQYRINGLLGTGGMGAVYRAEQTQPRRTVALKVIRAGWATPALLRRFTHEAEALGRLRHPGIAQIFEAGSAQGPEGRETPFFAMELVEGLPLNEHAAKRSLGLRERLALFALVCDAAHHAHQKGIVHRDLKPGNILVEEESEGPREPEGESGGSTSVRLTSGVDLDARPKILDFGIARLTDSDAAMTTMQTDPGQIVGTLAYMSPEQVRGQVEKIDTRSDVYALGVVLFELLTGRLPFEVKGKGVPEAARLIVEDEPTMPGTLDRQVRGDLETIILKAIAKEPERRYQSAAELGADVRRHLSHMPIVARPATTMYQLQKFARRNRALVGGVVAAFTLLVLGVVGTTWQMLRALEAEKLATARERTAAAEARKAKKSVDFLVTMLTSADPDKTAGKEVTVREILDQAAVGVGESLKEDPEVHFAARSAIGRTYRAVGASDKGEAHTQEALRLAASLYGENSLEYAAVLHELAHVYTDLRQWRKIVEFGERALKILEAQPQPDATRISRACALVGGGYVSMGDTEAGERMARRAYDLAVSVDNKEDIASAAGLLSDILQRVGGEKASAEGEKFQRMQLETLIALHGALNSETLHAKESLGWFLANERRTKEALPLLEEAEAGYRTLYGAGHRLRLNMLVLVSRCYVDLSELDKAEALAQEAVDGLATVAPDGPEMSLAQIRLGRVNYLRKNFAAAETHYREALRIQQAMNDPRVVVSLSALAGALQNQGKLEQALEISGQAIEYKRKSANLSSDFGTMLNNHAAILVKLERHEEAEKVFTQSIEHDRKVRPGHPLNGINLRVFAAYLISRHRPGDAEPLAREAWELVKAQAPQERRNCGTVLVKALGDLGRAADAAAVQAEMDALPGATAAAGGQGTK